MIRLVEDGDISQICDIYNYYVENTIVTFEESSVSVEEMSRRIDAVRKSYVFFVYEENGEILGYAYASKWMTRSAFRYSVETTVYLKYNITGKGIGSKLYETLISYLKEKKVHAAIASLAIPNEKSEALQQKFGFEKVAHYKEVGYKFEKWIDVGHWELIF